MNNNKKISIVYCTPSLYIPGGVERVLTLKANYFADIFGYEVTIVLTDGLNRPNAFTLSDKVKVINLNINFEELWHCSFLNKMVKYLLKQYRYKKELKKLLMNIRPDITDSLLRREVNFITEINDGSVKIGELHVSKRNFRTYKDIETNFIKEYFSKYWISSTIPSIKRLKRFVVLTEEDKDSWNELNNVVAIPNPVSFTTKKKSNLTTKRILSVGRYDYVKGYDLLLKAWSKLENSFLDWRLDIYGAGNKGPYYKLIDELGIDQKRCGLNDSTDNIEKEYLESSVYVLSSRFEGFPMVLLEAMSCGLPVVSFACPCGPRDAIVDGVNGLLVRNGDVDELVKVLSRIMSNAELRSSISNAALDSIKRYNIDSIANRWRTLFEEVLNDDNNG